MKNVGIIFIPIGTNLTGKVIESISKVIPADENRKDKMLYHHFLAGSKNEENLKSILRIDNVRRYRHSDGFDFDHMITSMVKDKVKIHIFTKEKDYKKDNIFKAIKSAEADFEVHLLT